MKGAKDGVKATIVICKEIGYRVVEQGKYLPVMTGCCAVAGWAAERIAQP